MRTRAFAAGLGVATVISLAAVPALHAAAADDVRLHVSVDGNTLDGADSADPIVLDPRHPSTVHVEIDNDGDQPVAVRTLRLDGSVAGLDFFAFETTLGIDVAPHTTATRDFPLDLAALDGQAVGLLPSTIELLDADRDVIVSERSVVDVRGSIGSVYGLWGIVAGILTAIQLVQLVLALANHRLPRNRWRRALRFASLGASFGLLVVFGLSAGRIMAPYPTVWAPVVGGASLVMFVLGWLAPAPDPDDEEDEDDAPTTESPVTNGADDDRPLAAAGSRTTRPYDVDLTSAGSPLATHDST